MKRKTLSVLLTIAITFSIVPVIANRTLILDNPKPVKLRVVEAPKQAPSSVKITKNSLECLAKNIYFEARNQPVVGQVAVAFVTLNRALSSKFPNDICGVVYQKYDSVCQFSWVCEGHGPPRNVQAWAAAMTVAKLVAHQYDGDMKDPTRGALFYHANYVEPSWRKHLHQTTVIADHIFYKFK